MNLRIMLAEAWNRVVRVNPRMSSTYDVVLDLGTQMGHTSKLIRGHANHLIGLDIYPPFLKRALEKGNYDGLVIADINHLPILVTRIDCATLFDVIEHLAKEDGLRLLKSIKGKVLLTTPRGEFANRLYSRLTGNRHEEHLSHWTREELEGLGFTVEVERPWFRFLPKQGAIVAYKAADALNVNPPNQ